MAAFAPALWHCQTLPGNDCSPDDYVTRSCSPLEHRIHDAILLLVLQACGQTAAAAAGVGRCRGASGIEQHVCLLFACIFVSPFSKKECLIAALMRALASSLFSTTVGWRNDAIDSEDTSADTCRHHHFKTIQICIEPRSAVQTPSLGRFRGE